MSRLNDQLGVTLTILRFGRFQLKLNLILLRVDSISEGRYINEILLV